MRRLALLAAGLAILAVAVATTAVAEDPPGSEFIDPNNNRAPAFAVPSMDGWEVKGDAVNGTKPARVVRVDRQPTPTATDPLSRQGLALLWAKQCTVEKQRLVFERNVYLAGPEYKLGAAIDFHVGSGAPRFKSGRMLVNGVEILKVGPGGGGFDQTADRPRAFLFGNNTVKVIVVKRSNGSDRRCNTPGTAPVRRSGVRFNIFGEFAGDVALPPQKAVQHYRLPDAGGFEAADVTLRFDVRNNGPGGLARVPLYITLDAPTARTPAGPGTVVEVAKPQPPVQSCKLTPPEAFSSVRPRTVLCTIANLRSGETAQQKVRIVFNPQQGGGRTALNVRWSAFVDEPAGANGTDNERAKTFYFCRHDDPGPECDEPED